MTDLSPAAKAIADAFEEAWRMTPEADPYECCVSPVAAALRAAADQVVPEEPLHHGDQRWQFERDTRQQCRLQFLAIAAELEGVH